MPCYTGIWYFNGCFHPSIHPSLPVTEKTKSKRVVVFSYIKPQSLIHFSLSMSLFCPLNPFKIYQMYYKMTFDYKWPISMDISWAKGIKDCAFNIYYKWISVENVPVPSADRYNDTPLTVLFLSTWVFQCPTPLPPTWLCIMKQSPVWTPGGIQLQVQSRTTASLMFPHLEAGPRLWVLHLHCDS